MDTHETNERLPETDNARFLALLGTRLVEMSYKHAYCDETLCRIKVLLKGVECELDALERKDTCDNEPEKVRIENDNCLIQIWRGYDPYWIPKKQLETAEGALSWIWHLCEKNWFTTDRVAGIIRVHEKLVKEARLNGRV